MPWYDIQPVIASHPVTSMFLALSVLTGLLAAWYHFRMDYAGHTEVKDNRRNRILASTPLLVVAVIMVLGEVGSLAKGAVFRYPMYTTAKANLAALESGLSPSSCAMADDVLAEPDPNAGMLQPVPGQTFGSDGPLGGVNPVGFKPEGVGEDLKSDPVVSKPGVVNSDASPNKPNAAITDSAGTAGGKGPVGVNGSHAALPFGLDPARTPVMGSYGENTLAATATSAWYQLPARSADRPLVVISAAGPSGLTKRTATSSTASL
ncbi:mycobacterial cell wall arabinan synthesis family protein [Mycobacterium kansasii]|uniref:Mycobacterial cell wall arabinan synthesis family protein n=1 Tax=Mycobacterium kansasii TaxID=1768 RepID=A0A1V3X8U4_MYCKA|nr:mycobacterial cell wall arabinan synthesis family protein [Mycobacterium kansasii]